MKTVPVGRSLMRLPMPDNAFTDIVWLDLDIFWCMCAKYLDFVFVQWINERSLGDL